MLDRNTFTETLREVAEIVRTASEPLAKEEILEYFKDMELNDSQKDMVFEYLLTPHDEDKQPQPESDNENDAGPVEEKPSRVLEMYFEELEALPEYTDEELYDMYEELLNGNKEVINTISNSMLKSVAILADEYASEKVEAMDLIQEGNMAVFIRLSELCGLGADCGYDLEDELNEAVNDAMKLYVSGITGEEDSENTIVGKANLVREAQKYLREQNKSEPSIAELSRYTMLSGEELADIIGMIDKAGKKM